MSSSRLNKFLKYINFLVAAVLLAALAAAAWFVWRPLPKTSGVLEAPILRSAKITRDKLGSPRISAESMEDAIFLQGFVHAQDRLWQLDALRRAGAGQLSEIFGPATLETDREMRRLRLHRLAEQHARTLAPSLRAHFAAYARGVNWFIETNRNNLPVEFTLLRYDPRPWTIADSILAGMLLYRELTSTWETELRKQTLLSSGERELVEQLFPTHTGSDVQPGSNAWVIAGSRTASGKPILANDTHLENALPSKWYMIHLQAPKLNVAGFSIPGLPSVVVGHNDRIAWGVTNLHFDVQDLYIEKLNPSTGQYVYNGSVETARGERELIYVKGQSPVEHVNWVTRHGPVWSVQGNQLLTLRWIAGELFAFPFFELNAAANWSQFRKSLAEFPGPAQNFVYADVDGNIGYQVAGRLPIRRGFRGDVPVDGTVSASEWEGFIPFDALPAAFNPPSGVIVTANQNPFPPDYPYPVHGNFGPPYRARQIRGRLLSRQGWKTSEMLAIQKDVYSSLSHFLAKQVVAAYDKRGTRNQELVQAAEILRAWNGQMEKDLAAPLIATLVFQHLRTAVANRAAPGKVASYETQMAGIVIEQILRARSPAWFGDFDQLLLRCFVDAVEEGKRLQGRAVAKWSYGAYTELRLTHPVLGRLPWLGKYFTLGPFPQSGSATTVKQTTRRIGPSMRFVADLSNWDASYHNLMTGQSGQPLSGHFKDQWEAHSAGESFPMRWTTAEGDVLTVVPLNKR